MLYKRIFKILALMLVVSKLSMNGMAEGSKSSFPMTMGAVQVYADTTNQVTQPAISVSDEKLLYSNDETVQVTITANSQMDIYYTIDYSYDLQGGYLSDPTQEDSGRQLYTGTFSVNINDSRGGIVYICAVAVDTEQSYSTITRKDLAFSAALPASAVSANGVACNSFEEAVELINQSQNGGEIVLHSDVELSAETLENGMPEKPCVLTSNGEYTLKGTVSPLVANSDLTFVSIKTDINNIYANGYNMVIDSGVETAYAFWGPYLYSGSPYSDSNSTQTGRNPNVTVKSGTFTVYGSGAMGTTLDGSTSITVEENADVEIMGVAMGATVTGNVQITVKGDTVNFRRFTGEQNMAELQGNLTLSIYGTPVVNTYYSYTASILRTIGTLNLYHSELSAAMFTNFETINIRDSDDVDKAALQAKIEEAHSLEESKYTAASWAVLQKALEDADALLSDTNATQSQVDNQLAVLIAAINTLVEENPSDIAVQGVYINSASLITVSKGKTMALQAVIIPANATNQQVTWSSVTPAIASIDEIGILTAHKIGMAVISVSTEDGGFSSSIVVRVLP